MSSPNPIEATLARARDLVAENREAEAASLLERHAAPATAALHHEIALRAATNALQKRDIAAATAWLDRGLQRTPDAPDLNYFRGNLHLDSGQTAAATGCFRRCVAADPQREEYAVAFADALLTAGSPAEVSAIVAGFHDSARAQLCLAAALEQLGQITAARSACERAGRLQPELYPAWFHLGRLCEMSGDTIGALRAFTRAVAVRPQAASAHFAQATMLVRLGNLPTAVAAFERTLQLDPGLAEAHEALARARGRRDHPAR